jgi:Domain of unknown function (DUF4190)
MANGWILAGSISERRPHHGSPFHEHLVACTTPAAHTCGEMTTGDYPERSQAVTALVLGIVGLFFSIVSPFAWKFGHDELKAIDEGRRPPDGHGMATAGRILGIIGTVLLVVQVLVLLLIIPAYVTTT